MYKHFFKRFFDIVCALLALIVFCWLYAIIAILVRVKLGSPVLFKQIRPGMKDKSGQEKLFKLYKFRTMTDEKDENGEFVIHASRYKLDENKNVILQAIEKEYEWDIIDKKLKEME